MYAFSPDEQLISCCSCTVTPNALVSLSAVSDLISNTLTPARPNSIVVKLIATAGTTCNASNVPVANLAAGMVAWGTTIHAAPTSPVTYSVTETAFKEKGLSAAELARVTSFCGFIQSNGSGFGICRSCRLGGLGATEGTNIQRSLPIQRVTGRTLRLPDFLTDYQLILQRTTSVMRLHYSGDQLL